MQKNGVIYHSLPWKTLYVQQLAWLYSTKWQPGRQYTLQMHLQKEEKGPNPGNNQEAKPKWVEIPSERAFLVLKKPDYFCKHA